jgi:hypothetical protein
LSESNPQPDTTTPAPEGARAHLPHVPLPSVLRIFWAGSVAAFLLMLLVGYVEYRLGYPPPHYNPLGGPRYEDLMEFPSVFKLAHTAAFFAGVGGSRVAYPPLGAVLYALLYATGHPVRWYLGTAAVWLAAVLWGVRQGLIAHGISVATATLFPLTVALVSFPIAGLLQRGNIELFVWIFTAVGAWAFLRGRDDAAAVLWGLAAAVKLYPIVLLALLLPRRRWRAFALGVTSFVGVTLASLMWLGPTISVAWRGSMENVFGYQGRRVGEWTLHELAANHSAFGWVKLTLMIFGRLPLPGLTLPYYACGAAVFALAFFARLWRMPVANQLLAVTAFMVVLPPISYFYTLVHLYAAWVMLVFVAVRAETAGAGGTSLRVPGLTATMLLLVPVFASFMLFTFAHILLFGGLVQAALLLSVFGCALRFPFPMNTSETG